MILLALFIMVFVTNFNLFSCEYNFIFRILYCVILYQYYIEQKEIYNNLTVPCEKIQNGFSFFIKNEDDCCISCSI